MNSLQSLKNQLAKLREQKQPLIRDLQSRMHSQQELVKQLTDKLLHYQQSHLETSMAELQSNGYVWGCEGDRKYVVVDVSAVGEQGSFSWAGGALVRRGEAKGLEVGCGGAEARQQWSQVMGEVGNLQALVLDLRGEMEGLKKKYEQEVRLGVTVRGVKSEREQVRGGLSQPIILAKDISLASSQVKQSKRSLDLAIAEVVSHTIKSEPNSQGLSQSSPLGNKQASLPPIYTYNTAENDSQIIEQQKQSQSSIPVQNTNNPHEQTVVASDHYGELKSKKTSLDAIKSNELKLTTYIEKDDERRMEKMEKSPMRGYAGGTAADIEAQVETEVFRLSTEQKIREPDSNQAAQKSQITDQPVIPSQAQPQQQHQSPTDTQDHSPQVSPDPNPDSPSSPTNPIPPVVSSLDLRPVIINQKSSIQLNLNGISPAEAGDQGNVGGSTMDDQRFDERGPRESNGQNGQDGQQGEIEVSAQLMRPQDKLEQNTIIAEKLTIEQPQNKDPSSQEEVPSSPDADHQQQKQSEVRQNSEDAIPIQLIKQAQEQDNQQQTEVIHDNNGNLQVKQSIQTAQNQQLQHSQDNKQLHSATGISQIQTPSREDIESQQKTPANSVPVFDDDENEFSVSTPNNKSGNKHSPDQSQPEPEQNQYRRQLTPIKRTRQEDSDEEQQAIKQKTKKPDWYSLFPSFMSSHKKDEHDSPSTVAPNFDKKQLKPTEHVNQMDKHAQKEAQVKQALVQLNKDEQKKGEEQEQLSRKLAKKAELEEQQEMDRLLQEISQQQQKQKTLKQQKTLQQQSTPAQTNPDAQQNTSNIFRLSNEQKPQLEAQPAAPKQDQDFKNSRQYQSEKSSEGMHNSASYNVYNSPTKIEDNPQAKSMQMEKIAEVPSVSEIRSGSKEESSHKSQHENRDEEGKSIKTAEKKKNKAKIVYLRK